MEGPIEPNMGPSLADVLLCTFESTNAGFSSFPPNCAGGIREFYRASLFFSLFSASLRKTSPS